MPEYPGTPQHQALLQAIANHYQTDPRIRSVIVFGSLGRGNWDTYSDIDLDVIITEDIDFDLPFEVNSLGQACAAAGEHLALRILDGSDSADLVFESLLQLSVRYHTLAETKPAILDSMRVLAGDLAPAVIAAAGEANRRPESALLDELLERCVRYAVVALVGVQRRRVWYTVEVLHRMRSLLMEIYTRTHGGQRALTDFETLAAPELQEKLGTALPVYDQAALQAALGALLELLDQDLQSLSNGQLRLHDSQQAILNGVRKEHDFGA